MQFLQKNYILYGIVLAYFLSAHATDFPVASSSDLVSAINSVNAGSGGDSITFTTNITLEANLPVISKAVTINGGGFTLDGNNAFRFLVATSSITVSNLIMTQGLALGGTGGTGANAFSGGGGGGAGMGGAIFVNRDQTVTLSNATLTKNTAQGGAGGPIGTSGSLIGAGGGGGSFSSTTKNGATPNGGGDFPGLSPTGGASSGSSTTTGYGGGGGGVNGNPQTPSVGGGSGSGVSVGSSTGGGNGGYCGGGGGGVGVTNRSGGGGGDGGGNGGSNSSIGGGGGGYGSGGAGGVTVAGGPTGSGGPGGGGFAGGGGGGTGGGNNGGGGGGGFGGGGGGGGDGVGSGTGGFFGGSGGPVASPVNNSPAGGGGAGIGGAIFVADTASLVIQDGITIGGPSNANITVGGVGGTAASGASGFAGSAYANDVFLFKNASLTFSGTTNMTASFAIQSDDPTITNQPGSHLTANSFPDGGVIKNGSCKVTLSSTSNNYRGGTVINAGTLSISANSNLGAVTLGATVTSGPITMSGGILESTGTFTTARNIVLTGNAEIDATAATLTISGVISESGGARALTTGSTGTVTLTATNTFTGGLIVNSGALVLSGVGSISATNSLTVAPTNGTAGALDISGITPATGVTVTSFSGGTSGVTALGTKNLTFTNSSPATYSGTITGSGSLTKQGSGSFTLSAASVGYSGTTNLNAGTLDLTASGAAGTGAIAMSASTTLSLGSTTTFSNTVTLAGSETITVSDNTATLSGVISGASGSITKTGSGTLALSGTNTYSKGTNLNAGAISIGRSSALGTAALNMAGTTTLILESGISPTNNIAVTSLQTATVDVAASTSTLSGIISGSGSDLVKTGAGALTLTSSNTINGTLAVEGGVLSLATNGSLTNATIDLSGANTSFNISAITATNTTIANLQGVLGATVTLGAKSLTVGNGNAAEFAGVIEGTGSITKQGSEVLTLTNANIYTGTTTITNGTLDLSDDGSIASSPLVISSGTFAISGINPSSTSIPSLTGSSGTSVTLGSKTLIVGSNNATTIFDGVISGNGGLTKEGSGDITFSATNNYMGTTTVNGGSIVLTGNGSISSVLVVDGGGSVNYSGITGNSIAVEDFITSGVSVIDNGTKDFIVDTASINGNASLSGTGDLIKETTGLFNSFSGSTLTLGRDFLIQAGTALVNGEITAVNVTNGALLKGNGSFTAGVQNFGTIAPGESIGTLTILSGDYEESGTYEVEFDGDGQTDLIDVLSGNITINPGSTLTLLPEITDSYLPGQEYIILQASGSRTGTYTTVDNSTLPLLNITVVYGANNVMLKIPGGETPFNPFSSLIQGGNIGAVAKYLDYLSGTASGDLLYVIDQLRLLELPQLKNALNQLQPASFLDVSLSQQNNSVHVRQSLTQRIMDLYDSSCSRHRLNDYKWSFWGDAFVDYSSQDGSVSRLLFGFNNMMEGGSLGLDYEVIQNLYVGVMGAYTYSKIKWKDESDQAQINSGYLGVYTSYFLKHLFANASIIGSYSTYKGNRTIQFPGVNRRAFHSNHASGVDVHTDFGFILPAAAIDVLPYGSVDYIHIHEKGFKEKGANSIDLHTRDENFNLLRLEAGVNFTTCLRTEFAKWMPKVRLGWVREIRYNETLFTSNFVGSGGQFTVSGLNPRRTMISPGIGLTTLFKQDKASFSLSYDAEICSKFVDQLGNTRLNFSF